MDHGASSRDLLEAVLSVDHRAQASYLGNLPAEARRVQRLLNKTTRRMVDSHQDSARAEVDLQELPDVLARIAHIWPRCLRLILKIYIPDDTSTADFWQIFQDAAMAMVPFSGVRACRIDAQLPEGNLRVTPEGLAALTTLLPNLTEISIVGRGWTPKRPMGPSAYSALAHGAPQLQSLTLLETMYDDDGVVQLQGLRRLVLACGGFAAPRLVAFLGSGVVRLALPSWSHGHLALLPPRGLRMLSYLQHLSVRAIGLEANEHYFSLDNIDNGDSCDGRHSSEGGDSRDSGLPSGLRSLELDGEDVHLPFPTGADTSSDGVHWFGNAQMDLVSGRLSLRGGCLDMNSLAVITRCMASVAVVRAVAVHELVLTPQANNLLPTFTSYHTLEVEWATVDRSKFEALGSLLAHASRVEGLLLSDTDRNPGLWQDVSRLKTIADAAERRLPERLQFNSCYTEPSRIQLDVGLRDWTPLKSIAIEFEKKLTDSPQQLAGLLVGASRHVREDGWCGIMQKTSMQDAHASDDRKAREEAAFKEVVSGLGRALPQLRVQLVRSTYLWVVAAHCDAGLEAARKGVLQDGYYA